MIEADPERLGTELVNPVPRDEVSRDNLTVARTLQTVPTLTDMKPGESPVRDTDVGRENAVSYRPFIRLLPALLLGILFSATPARGQDGYRVIVNVANPMEGLTKPEAARLFLTRTTWDTGDPVYPVNLAETSPVREEFSRDVLGLTPTVAIQQWKRATGAPPAWMATEREVLAFVRLKRGAIGYVSSAANLQGVKVLTVVKAPSR